MMTCVKCNQRTSSPRKTAIIYFKRNGKTFPRKIMKKTFSGNCVRCQEKTSSPRELRQDKNICERCAGWILSRYSFTFLWKPTEKEQKWLDHFNEELVKKTSSSEQIEFQKWILSLSLETASVINEWE